MVIKNFKSYQHFPYHPSASHKMDQQKQKKKKEKKKQHPEAPNGFFHISCKLPIEFEMFFSTLNMKGSWQVSIIPWATILELYIHDSIRCLLHVFWDTLQIHLRKSILSIRTFHILSSMVWHCHVSPDKKNAPILFM